MRRFVVTPPRLASRCVRCSRPVAPRRFHVPPLGIATPRITLRPDPRRRSGSTLRVVPSCPQMARPAPAACHSLHSAPWSQYRSAVDGYCPSRRRPSSALPYRRCTQPFLVPAPFLTSSPRRLLPHKSSAGIPLCFSLKLVCGTFIFRTHYNDAWHWSIWTPRL